MYILIDEDSVYTIEVKIIIHYMNDDFIFLHTI